MSKIGIIAGNGRFPFLVAEEIKRTGDQVYLAAIKEETDKNLEKLADKTRWLALGQIQKLIDFFKEENVKTAVMAGQVKHVQIFAVLKLDLRAAKMLASLKNKKTDSLLGAVADELSKDGITLLPSHKYLRHLLPEKGMLIGRKPSKNEQDDIDFGFKTAKQIAGLDIGQTIVVKDKAVVAVESMEGTDECIKRAFSLGKDRIIVIKVAKPNQDMRFDIPVIGPRTVSVMSECKAGVLAVESGSTLMIDRDQLVKSAKEKGITIIAL
ncbi:MAG: UDP-2,3-diacylglucosamine diphosphatase LpxI [Elusimicrobiota bacterium]